ncbi:piggyBac transposable element-derived 3-like protein [Labeo rohita]|uniref:PiggyBac transposable element-derived 3-like protein n=1 Tax=Labeo rohita TaxID=84645 RepID=A0A498LVF2_LABRO|nr:piggyBac transposable element-derived 3-like protein [Labeo rohita]
MSCIRYPTIRMYWSKALKTTAITDKFTRARFFKLRGAIKVVIDHDVPEDLRMSDKFWKMIPLTGAGPYRQYLPMKPNPVGIKNFVCATADGIVLDFELYQGTGSLIGKVEEPEGLGLGSLVVEHLCQTLHRGTKVYCDRFFTTIKGAQRMMEKELYMTGTIMKNRLAGAKHKLPSDKAMKNAGRDIDSALGIPSKGMKKARRPVVNPPGTSDDIDWRLISRSLQPGNVIPSVTDTSPSTTSHHKLVHVMLLKDLLSFISALVSFYTFLQTTLYNIDVGKMKESPRVKDLRARPLNQTVTVS